MDKNEKIEKYLAEPARIGRIATVSPKGQPHVVPVWFMWEDGIAWVHSFMSTKKVEHLLKNPRCALVVDGSPAEPGMMGVLIKGKAEIITSPAGEVRSRAEKIYRRYLNEEELNAPDPQSWLGSDEGLVIKITPHLVKSI